MLTAEREENVSLDLQFDADDQVVFTSTGSAVIHLAGYYMAPEEYGEYDSDSSSGSGSGSDDSEEEHYARAYRRPRLADTKHLLDGSDDDDSFLPGEEDDDDEDDDESDEDEDRKSVV